MMKEKKQKIIKLVILALILITISAFVFVLLRVIGIKNITDLRETIASCGVWAWVVFLILQVVLTILLCFIPASNMSFIALGVLLFGANYKTFLLCFSGVLLSSVGMDLLGRFGLEKIVIFLIGQDDYNKAKNLINEYGKTYIPLFYLFPLFPDDAICFVVGSMRLNFWYHFLSILICRGIGVATIVFGVQLIPSEVANFTSTNLWDYIEVLTVIAFWVIVAFFVATKINKFLLKRKQKNDKIKNDKKE